MWFTKEEKANISPQPQNITLFYFLVAVIVYGTFFLGSLPLKRNQPQKGQIYQIWFTGKGNECWALQVVVLSHVMCHS